jgi:hypothetical protein
VVALWEVVGTARAAILLICPPGEGPLSLLTGLASSPTSLPRPALGPWTSPHARALHQQGITHYRVGSSRRRCEMLWKGRTACGMEGLFSVADAVLDLQDELDEHRRAVDTEYFDLSIREIVRMVESNEIVVAPAYQRQFQWKEPVQSALIESLLLGLPIPAIFVATNRDGTWDVVDGLQRIATIMRFHGIDVPDAVQLQFGNDALRLCELTQLSSFNGLTHDDLPMPIRLMFGKRYIRVQVLSDKSDAEVRFELFRRLNAGAVALTPQEIRACVFNGPFNSMLDELAGLDEFQSLLKLRPQNQHDGTSAELVLKFFAYLDRMDTFDGKVTRFLNDYIKGRTHDSDLEKERALFLQSVRFLRETIGDGPFKRDRVSTTPLNQLEAVLVGIAKVYAEGKTPVAPIEGWQNDPDLVEASTKGTNSRSMLTKRVNRAKDLFLGNE